MYNTLFMRVIFFNAALLICAMQTFAISYH